MSDKRPYTREELRRIFHGFRGGGFLRGLAVALMLWGVIALIAWRVLAG